MCFGRCLGKLAKAGENKTAAAKSPSNASYPVARASPPPAPAAPEPAALSQRPAAGPALAARGGSGPGGCGAGRDLKWSEAVEKRFPPPPPPAPLPARPRGPAARRSLKTATHLRCPPPPRLGGCGSGGSSRRPPASTTPPSGAFPRGGLSQRGASSAWTRSRELRARSPPLPGAPSHAPLPPAPCTPPRPAPAPPPRGWDGGDPAEDAAAPPRRRRALGKGQGPREGGRGPSPRAAGSAPGRSGKLRTARGARTERWRRGRLRLSPRLTPAATGTAARRGAGRNGGDEPPPHPAPLLPPRGSRGRPPRNPRPEPSGAGEAAGGARRCGRGQGRKG